jgi:hypothetical protein
MSKMFPVYDKNLWEAIAATVESDTAFKANSTYCSVPANSTIAMGAAQVGTTQRLVFVAYEAPINRTHLLYSYTT